MEKILKQTKVIHACITTDREIAAMSDKKKGPTLEDFIFVKVNWEWNAIGGGKRVIREGNAGEEEDVRAVLRHQDSE